MAGPSLWSRLRNARVIQVLAVYLGASWVVLQVTNDLQQALDLPSWVPGVAVVLLLVGLVITLATAWLQSHPETAERAARDEVPDRWELELGELGRSLRQGQVPHLTWARALVAGLIAFSLLFGLAGVYVLLRGSGHAPLGPEPAAAAEAPDGIAVLPFDVRGPGLGDWREGMVDVLSTGLDGAAGLRAISSRTVLARWNELVKDTANVDEPTALEVAKRTGARYALLGSAVAFGPSVRLVADVYALDSGQRIGEAQVEGAPDSVMSLVDRLAAKTLGLILKRDDSELPHIDLASITTGSLPALKAYLEGEVQFRHGDFPAAAAAFERAVADDSMFGLAYYRLSEAYGWTEGITTERGAEALTRAQALVQRMPERQALEVRVASKIREFDPTVLPLAQQGVKKYPDDAEAWYQLGESYIHVRGTLGNWDDIHTAFQRAVELAPRFAPYRIHLIDEAFDYYADSAMTAQRLAAYERLAPSSPTDTIYRIATALMFGDTATRDSALRVLQGLPWLTHRMIHNVVYDPRSYGIDTALVQRELEIAPPGARTELRQRLATFDFFFRGRLRASLAGLAEVEGAQGQRRGLPVIAQGLGMPMPDSMVEWAAHADISRAGGDELLPLGVYAADHGNWSRLETVSRRSAKVADSLSAAGDSAHAIFLRQDRALGAIGLWKRGRLQEAMARMDSVRSAQPNNELPVIWLGLMHEQAGEPQEALKYFRAAQVPHPDPYIAYHIGRDYARLGEKEKARQALSLFIGAWADADPEFQPMVQEARQILTGLGKEGAGEATAPH